MYLFQTVGKEKGRCIYFHMLTKKMLFLFSLIKVVTSNIILLL